MLIEYNDETNQVTQKHLDLVEQLLQHAAKEEAIKGDTEVAVSFVDNKKIQEINRDYRGIDRPTDVISFALEDEHEEEMVIANTPDMPVVLGDIIISIDRTTEQAREYNHSFERELGFLALHGFLHLLGYDHIEADDEEMMTKKQEDILYGFGLSRN